MLVRIVPVLFVIMTLAACSQAGANSYHDRPEVIDFIQELVDSEGFAREDLEAVFRDAVFKQNIIDAISRPAERVLTWKEYQDIFLTERRVNEGLVFMAENRETLDRVEADFGVPAEIVVAIIGVETMYGRIRGSYRVIDALSTLAFDYPPRASFFRKELKEFLLLAREEKKSPVDPVGSYAGAMGYGQFIPSSYRHYAIDFDGDGFRDIWNNPVDAIGSVGNYLHRHGWQRHEPITVAVTVAPDPRVAAIFEEALKPSSTVATLKTEGVAVPSGLDDDLAVAPLIFRGKQGVEHWIGFDNFYVITRYNHSKLYAMAVFQLSERLKGKETRVAD